MTRRAGRTVHGARRTSGAGDGSMLVTGFPWNSSFSFLNFGSNAASPAPSFSETSASPAPCRRLRALRRVRVRHGSHIFHLYAPTGGMTL